MYLYFELKYDLIKNRFEIDVYKNSSKYKDISKFMVNHCLLNHSWCTVQRFYSSVNLIKNQILNILYIESVSIKSYYKEDFQITQKHHGYYKNFIKDSDT